MVDDHYSNTSKETINVFIFILVNSNTKNYAKVHMIGDRSLIARSGGVADTQHVVEIVQWKVGNSCGVLGDVLCICLCQFFFVLPVKFVAINYYLPHNYVMMIVASPSSHSGERLQSCASWFLPSD